ncbi:MAG: ArsB/NhaD family transporter [Bacillota bacterium]
MLHYQIYLAVVIFIATYILIVSERIHRTVAAFVGAAIIILAGIIPSDKAAGFIDWNTIGLLVGMMIIVGVTRETGIFEFLAIRAAQAAKGHPLAILSSLAFVTAFVSAFLDNVTTVLLIVPVTFAIARKLDLNPMPFLVAEIIASNVGGTATLIGDPPNIMIGSATRLGFMDFIVNLAPVVILIQIVTVFLLELIYRKDLYISLDRRNRIFEFDARAEIKDYHLLRKSLIVLGLVIAGFLLHQYLHIESMVVALSGAALLLLVTRTDPERPLNAVEWPVIFFFIGLFLLVGALERVGVISLLARLSLEATHSATIMSGMLILWLSALSSAFIDNIPFVATMIPLIKEMGRLGHIQNLNFLWWCLSLGACLGGNGTIIGASANVVVAGIAEKRGLLISFIGYMKVAFPLMLVSIVISSGYMFLWAFLPTILAAAITLSAAIILYLILLLSRRSTIEPGDKDADTH